METIQEDRRANVEGQEHSEEMAGRAIEEQTAKLPPDVFLWGALASQGGSLLLHVMGKKEECVFVGQWWLANRQPPLYKNESFLQPLSAFAPTVHRP
jgi:hypothetical protein